MKYFDVLWRHTNPREPLRLVFEVDETGWEVRKLEFFADGRIGYAFGSCEVGDTRLGIEPMPPLSEINEQDEFDGKEMEAEGFEKLWSRHVGHAI